MGNKKINYQVRRATAARAIYQEGRGSLPKIALTFETYDDEEVEFELTFDIAADMIDQATAAYNAGMRPLKNQRSS